MSRLMLNKHAMKWSDTPYSSAPDWANEMKQSFTPYSSAPDWAYEMKQSFTPYSSAPDWGNEMKQSFTPYSSAPDWVNEDDKRHALCNEREICKDSGISLLLLSISNQRGAYAKAL